MWLLDQWAERHISEAQAKGEFDNLLGNGEPLMLDDDSHVPPELRAGYRLLKNAGCLPPELEQHKEAIQLLDILKGIRQDDQQYQEVSRQLSLLELKLRQAGLSTEFLRGEYADKLLNKINDN
ncbi:DUF1992 domain-containing protein [Escherichia albertii]|uniref:DUF1992 domain-containing protein n=1 Tax=Escherichia coli TaxID=562 RepID=A0A765X955_ECOLX|nr:DUF1992 domain-containing protein [Escherichia albertii]EGM7735929.1 DUF1992 domain-containing protein [Escherichia albertii]EHW5677231.1 DUF1992 domain-containing protein [Escherichia albertii]MCZ8911635.1 DUF1992 domain-containing protein [Escherichia albertii]MCZ8939811.1 DUF1992 domain-containing protein [Escherichia albertii]MCZ8944481.1 DUF1992 domain-containing protein [Escherichia albertii]